MSASDAGFDSTSEGVTATLSTTVFNALSQGTHTIYVHGKDAVGNWGACDSATFFKDTVKPTVTINQAATQSDPTNGSPINFRVVFSEPVTGFTGSDVTLSGSAGATTATVSGSGTTYNVAV